MKIVLFSLLCLFLIGMTSYSYAQNTPDDENTELPEVLLQIVLRDSNGSLVAYIETEHFYSFNHLELNIFLDNQNQTRKEFFIKDDKKYESQKWETKHDEFSVQRTFSSTILKDVYQNEFVLVAQMLYDSYQTQPGDTARFFWTVVRPVS